jgi:nitrogen fixation/metabolism regulation signal transduction histidine kinase
MYPSDFPTPSVRSQRKLRNYLLDRKFQLKYANLAAGIALVLSVSLGALLWTASEHTVVQSRAAVALGSEVLVESRKVSEVVAMNIVRDPVYSENPSLKAAFEADAKAQAATLGSQQARLEGHAATLERARVQFGAILIASLLLLVAMLWMGGIVLTHRVAGPIHKMKKQLRAVRDGDWAVPGPLRRGDELTEFFDTFNDMVTALRERRIAEIQELDAVLTRAAGRVPEAELEQLKALRATLEQVLRPRR